jgi:hypothetical protein
VVICICTGTHTFHTGGVVPKTEIEIDIEIARQVSAAGFDPQEISRLKLLVAGADPQSFS